MAQKLEHCMSSVLPTTREDGDAGLSGARDAEMHGKVLPCHKVKEDGIVRITPATVSTCDLKSHVIRLTLVSNIDGGTPGGFFR